MFNSKRKFKIDNWYHWVHFCFNLNKDPKQFFAYYEIESALNMINKELQIIKLEFKHGNKDHYTKEWYDNYIKPIEFTSHILTDVLYDLENCPTEIINNTRRE